MANWLLSGCKSAIHVATTTRAFRLMQANASRLSAAIHATSIMPVDHMTGSLASNDYVLPRSRPCWTGSMASRPWWIL